MSSRQELGGDIFWDLPASEVLADVSPCCKPERTGLEDAGVDRKGIWKLAISMYNQQELPLNLCRAGSRDRWKFEVKLGFIIVSVVLSRVCALAIHSA